MIRSLLFNGTSNNWNISKAIFTRGITVFDQTQVLTGMAFSTDGTKMYLTDVGYNNVYQYTLSTAWNISTALYVRAFNVGAKETSSKGLCFSPDGTKMYIIGINSDSVHQYTLSTAWDVSTAVWLRSLSVSAREGAPYGVTFSPDGTKMYIAGDASDSVHQYTLSTAWDISTAAYLRVLSVYAMETNVRGLYFSSDGTKLYTIGTTEQKVNQYTLSTAWDISTAVWLQGLSVGSLAIKPFDINFSSQGEYLYVIDNSANTYQILQYTM